MIKRLKLTGILLALMALLVACGGGDAGGDGGSTENDAQQADEPATATPFPTFAFVAPTNPPIFNQSAEETEEAEDSTEEATEEAESDVETEADTETVELDETMVSRGLGRYEALDCAVCHGEAGVGTDEVEGLLDYSGSQDEFITFMRTGGTIGNSHQYSTNRLSANGAQNLYQYVLSISQGE